MFPNVSLARAASSVAIALGALSCAPAQAQVAGWYDAVADDGSMFSLYVYDMGNGQLDLAQWGAQGPIHCPSGTVRPENYGFGVWAPVSAHADDERHLEGVYSHMWGDFSADGSTFTGSFVVKLPLFVDVTTNTHKAEVCSSGVHHFTATLQATASTQGRPQPLARGDVRYQPATR